MPKIMIRFEIDESIRRQFKALCAANGTTMSASLRRFIVFCVENDMLPPKDEQKDTQ